MNPTNSTRTRLLRVAPAARLAFAAAFAAAFSAGCSAGVPDDDFDVGGDSSSSSSGAGSSDGEPCEEYLGCLLVTSPQAYGAAIQLYGEDSACWQTPAQTAGCNQACESSLEELGGQCECSGSTCIACEPEPWGNYDGSAAGRVMTCDNGQDFPCEDLWLYFEDVDATTATLRLECYGGDSPLLHGDVPCQGSWTATGSDTDEGGYFNSWTVDLAPASDDEFNISAVWTRTFGSDHVFTCTVSGLVEW